MTYEYMCQACGHAWEAEQSIKEAPLKKCVACGAEKAKRLISGGTGFLLKGGGWYADGYGSAPAAKSDSAESKGDAKPLAADSAGGKAEGKEAGAKPATDKPATDKSSADKSSSDKASGEKASSDKSSSDAGSKGSGDSSPKKSSASSSAT